MGCADADLEIAKALASTIPNGRGEPIVSTDHTEILKAAKPDAVAIFTPHLNHYRHAMDALQAGAHVFIEKPLSTNTQEAVDIVRLAQARNRKVGVGHQFRLRPSIRQAKRMLAEGAIGELSMATAVLAQPWLIGHAGAENSWRFDPKISGGGVLADAGDHLLDALLWTTGQAAREVAAVQKSLQAKLDVVTAAAIRLVDGTPVSIGVSGVASSSLFEIAFYGERGRLLANERTLMFFDGSSTEPAPVDIPTTSESIDSNFVDAISANGALCCPASEAVDTVKLLEAVSRAVASGQVVQVA